MSAQEKVLLAALELALDLLESAEIQHLARTARLKGFVPDVRKIKAAVAKAKAGAA